MTALSRTPPCPRLLQRSLGLFGAGLIRVWLQLVGRKVRKADVPWLLGPIGPVGLHVHEAVVCL